MKREIKRLCVMMVICGLAASTAALGVQVVRLSRINQFSKNITISNNAFLHDNPQANGYEEEQERVESLSEAFYSSKLEMNGGVPKIFWEKRGLQSPTEKKLLDIPYLSQEGILPNGCEAVSATMLLQYNGFSISPLDFVDQYLDMQEVRIRWGCRFGPNPSEAYAGDPRSEKGGFGCFSPVIVRALEKAVGGAMQVKSVGGQSLSDIAHTYIDQGIPVAVWVTNGMKPLSTMYQWQSYDRDETYLYPAAEHCMVLVGYDADGYYLADPYQSNGVVHYQKDVVESRYEDMGIQAVAVTPLPSESKRT